MPPKRKTPTAATTTEVGEDTKPANRTLSPNRNSKRKAASASKEEAPSSPSTKRSKSTNGSPSRTLRFRPPQDATTATASAAKKSVKKVGIAAAAVSTKARQRTSLAVSEDQGKTSKESEKADAATTTPASFENNNTKKRGQYFKTKDEPSWETFFFRLAVYKQHHGGSVCPPSVTTDDDEQQQQDESITQLGRWVNRQRSKTGKSNLTDDQIAALDALGFSWSPREDDFNREWDKRFEELKAFAQEHGHCKVPLKHPGGLGDWVSKQRNAQQLYERMESGDLQKDIEAGKVQKPKKSRIMSPEHRDMLNSIGFVWKVYEHRGWDLKYQELMEYKEKHGHCLVPQHWPENKGLGKFVARQRYLYCLIQQGKMDKNPLTPERIAMLDAIGFHWGKVRPNTWKDPKTEEAQEKAEDARAKVVPGKISGSEESFVDITAAHRDEGNYYETNNSNT